ncbi:hypothetical protein B0T24DRAFT_722510 [Lasiosphaeria ovina]|uniref:Uncharacterized protein n=1 Tax=Lasiosphaeria ovina TaxID=92902 RepID=A0AAE0N511_9PEZI|nr:hypothetical protein B0T24DRAFT_722510 [Lasiosphaeria ovina]
MDSPSSSANKPEGSLGPIGLREKYPELDDMALQEIHLQDVSKANMIRDKAIELIRKAAATGDENVADELPVFDYELKRAEDFLVAAEAYRRAPKTSRDDDVAFLSFRSVSPNTPSPRGRLPGLGPAQTGHGDGKVESPLPLSLWQSNRVLLLRGEDHLAGTQNTPIEISSSPTRDGAAQQPHGLWLAHYGEGAPPNAGENMFPQRRPIEVGPIGEGGGIKPASFLEPPRYWTRRHRDDSPPTPIKLRPVTAGGSDTRTLPSISLLLGCSDSVPPSEGAHMAGTRDASTEPSPASRPMVYYGVPTSVMRPPKRSYFAFRDQEEHMAGTRDTSTEPNQASRVTRYYGVPPPVMRPPKPGDFALGSQEEHIAGTRDTSTEPNPASRVIRYYGVPPPVMRPPKPGDFALGSQEVHMASTRNTPIELSPEVGSSSFTRLQAPRNEEARLASSQNPPSGLSPDRGGGSFPWLKGPSMAVQNEKGHLVRSQHFRIELGTARRGISLGGIQPPLSWPPRDGGEASPDEQACPPGSRHMPTELSPVRRGHGDGRGRPLLYYWPSLREKAARMEASGGEGNLLGPKRGSSGPKSAPTAPDDPDAGAGSESGENTEPESEAPAKVRLSANLKVSYYQ